MPDWWCDRTRPAQSVPRLFREKLRQARPLQRCFREKVRPARHKPPIVGHFSCAGRTFSRLRPHRTEQGELFSRSGCCDVTALKPMTPLQPLMQTNVKPPSPMLAPQTATIETTITSATEKRTQNAHFSPAKAMPVSVEAEPVRAKAMEVSVGREQRRRRFHARDLRCPRAMAGPGQRTFACNSTADTSCVSLQSLKFQAFRGAADYRHQGIACEIAKQ